MVDFLQRIAQAMPSDTLLVRMAFPTLARLRMSRDWSTVLTPTQDGETFRGITVDVDPNTPDNSVRFVCADCTVTVQVSQ